MACRLLIRQTQPLLYRNRNHSLVQQLGFVRSLSTFHKTIPIFSNETRRTISSSSSMPFTMRDATSNPSASKRDCYSLPRKTSFLKRLLVVSIPYYCFTANTLPANGLLLHTRTRSNHHNKLNYYNDMGTFRRSAIHPKNSVRLFSTETTDSSQDSAASSDTSQEENTFSTDYHAPVMVHECLDALLDCQRGRIRNPNPKSYKKKHKKKKNKKHNKDPEGESESATTIAAAIDDFPPLIFVDGTLGGGGHSNALLQRLRPGDILFGCDVDPNALQTASERLSEYMNHSGQDRPLFVPVSTNFGDLAQTLPNVKHPETGEVILGEGVDGILLDLGVSSHQIDEPERGFSFMRDGPLDMRMGSVSSSGETNTNNSSSGGGITAADICNEFDEAELQRIFSVYGDEPRAKTIARAIVQHRPLHTTGGLVEAIASVTPTFAKNKRHGKTATCARVFQSLRIVVNNEDGVLGRVLSEACPTLLRHGGMLVVMSYHSMEDRATKRIMRDGTLEKSRSNRSDEKDMYGNYIGPPKPFKPVQKRRKATQDEIDRNPRARSAILRVAERQQDN